MKLSTPRNGLVRTSGGDPFRGSPNESSVEPTYEQWAEDHLLALGVTAAQVKSLVGMYGAQSRSLKCETLLRLAVHCGAASEEGLAKALAKRAGLPLAREQKMACHTLGDRVLSPSAARRLRVHLLGTAAGTLWLATDEPFPPRMREAERQIDESARGFAGPYAWSVATARELEHEWSDSSHVSIERAAGEDRRNSISLWVNQAIDLGASDLHFVPKEHALEVKLRIDGVLLTHQWLPEERREETIAMVKMAGGLDVGNRLEPLDGQSFHFHRGRRFKLRFSSLPSQFGQSVVVRLLDQSTCNVELSELGMGAQVQRDFERLLELPQGLSFLVGPTGSGKTTTLAALIGKLDGRSFAIRTLEDPIEYRLSHAVQTEIGMGLTFPAALRSLLRQDPDYLLIGETRDRETAQVAVEAGLTGHVCFSTLHASDAIGGMIRLMDLGLEVGPLLAACQLFAAQRLVRRLCTTCKRPVAEAAAEWHRLGLAEWAESPLWEAVGCPACRGGYIGRTAVFETRWISDFEDLLAKEGVRAAPLCRKRAQEVGATSLLQEAARKAAAGETSLAEVRAHISF